MPSLSSSARAHRKQNSFFGCPSTTWIGSSPVFLTIGWVGWRCQKLTFNWIYWFPRIRLRTSLGHCQATQAEQPKRSRAWTLRNGWVLPFSLSSCYKSSKFTFDFGASSFRFCFKSSKVLSSKEGSNVGLCWFETYGLNFFIARKITIDVMCLCEVSHKRPHWARLIPLTALSSCRMRWHIGGCSPCSTSRSRSKYHNLLQIATSIESVMWHSRWSQQRSFKAL